MTYFVTVEIICNEPGCGQRWHRTRANVGGMTKTRAGALASAEGWAIPGRPGSHDPRWAWCPDHAAGKIKRRSP